jgi:hypothetical protein
MATGRSIQLTRQVGEHLVVAELGRMGFIATPFAGNVPNFDLLVANEAGFTIPVQVKAINGGAWQFKITSFLDIEFKRNKQIVLGRKATPYPELVCVLVILGGAGKDKFFTMKFKDLQSHFFRNYSGGKRRNNSVHCAVWPRDLDKFNNWNVLLDTLKLSGKIRSRNQKAML